MALKHESGGVTAQVFVDGVEIQADLVSANKIMSLTDDSPGTEAPVAEVVEQVQDKQYDDTKPIKDTPDASSNSR